MNINQMARNYQRMFQFISRDYESAYQLQTRSAELSAQDRAKNDMDSLLQQMGISGLEGRTVREMAKYRLEQQKAQSTQQTEDIQQPANAAPDVGELVQQMYIRAQYAPISEEATADIQALALRDAMNSVGAGSAPDAAERTALIQKHLQDVAPSKRASAFNTMNKVWETELDRIGEHIREQDPSWTWWGDPFDAGILESYVPGINVWV